MPTYVKDGDRADRAEDILEEMKDEIRAFEKRVMEGRAELGEVDARYHATAEDYRAVLRKLGAVWAAKERKLLSLLTELRKVIPREEWNPMFTEVLRRMS